MADIFVDTKDSNGLWAVSTAFKSEQAKLQGVKPKQIARLRRNRITQGWQYGGDSYTITSSYGITKRAQQFRTAEISKLKNVYLHLGKAPGSSGIVTIDIVSGGNTTPSTTVIYTTTINATQIPDYYLGGSIYYFDKPVLIDLSACPELSAGSYYWIVVGYNNISIRIGYNNNLYTWGYSAYLETSLLYPTGIWYSQSIDLNFRLELSSGGYDYATLESDQTGIIKSGSVVRQVERELLTQTAISINPEFSNHKGYWNPQGQILNQEGKPIQAIRRTYLDYAPSTTGLNDIFLLSQGEYNVSFGKEDYGLYFNFNSIHANNTDLQAVCKYQGKKIVGIGSSALGVIDWVKVYREDSIGSWTEIGSFTASGDSRVVYKMLEYSDKLYLFCENWIKRWNGSTWETVGILPVADFSAIPTEGESPLNVQFTDESIVIDVEAFEAIVYEGLLYTVNDLGIVRAFDFNNNIQKQWSLGGFDSHPTFAEFNHDLYLVRYQELVRLKSTSELWETVLTGLNVYSYITQFQGQLILVQEDATNSNITLRQFDGTTWTANQNIITNSKTYIRKIVNIDNQWLYLSVQFGSPADYKANIYKWRSGVAELVKAFAINTYIGKALFWMDGRIWIGFSATASATVNLGQLWVSNISTCVVNTVSYPITSNKVIGAIPGLTIYLNPSVSLLDRAIIRLGLFCDWQVYSERLELWKGFLLPDGNTEYIPAFTGLVQDVDISDIGGTATVNTLDFNYYLQKVTAEKITMDKSDGSLTTKLNISEPISGGKGLPASTSITKVPVLSPIDKFPSSGKIKIDNEVISYTSKIDTTDEKAFDGCTRGADLTTPAEHRDGARVENCMWYVAPRMDRAVEMLVKEAGITDYQIEETITTADFEHFSYHGKTPSNPPFGVARCMCYDSVRDQFWFGIDDKLYLWKNGVWTLKGIPEAGSYIYRITVWESNGNVYFVTCLRSSKDLTDNANYGSYNGTFKLWKFNFASSSFLSLNFGTYQPFYIVTVGASGFGDYFKSDSRKGFFIAVGSLYFIYHSSPCTGFSACGLARMKLDTEVFYLVANYGYGDTTNGFEVYTGTLNFCQRNLNELYTMAIGVLWSGGAGGGRLYGKNIFIDPLTGNTSVFDIFSIGIGAHSYRSIPEFKCSSLSSVEKLFFVCLYNEYPNNYWRIYAINTDGTNFHIVKTYNAFTWTQGGDDCPRSFLQKEIGRDIYFLLGTTLVSGSDYKMYKMTFNEVIQDIAIPIAGEKGSPSDMVYKPSSDTLYGISYPLYILWQYSKQSIISAFNTPDFRANYGITKISQLIKDFAIASGFQAYFDEAGKFYFVKLSESTTPIFGFSENDIKVLPAKYGDTNQYPIVNKCIASLFDDTTQIIEADPLSESRIKFGLETLQMSNSWLNNAGSANALAKRMVSLYQNAQSLITVQLRWLPLLKVNMVATIIRLPEGLIKLPYSEAFELVPTYTAGDKYLVYELRHDDQPFYSQVKLRRV